LAIDNPEQFRAASFRVVAGLADPQAVSFESVLKPGQFLRHRGWRLYLDPQENADIFRQDATFFVQPGLADHTRHSLQPMNYPDCRLRQQDNMLMIGPPRQLRFAVDATFQLIPVEAATPPAAGELLNGWMHPLYGKIVGITPLTARGERIAARGDNPAVLIGTQEQGERHEWFRVVSGLADSAAVSFESISKPGHYLRHWGWEFSIMPLVDDDTFRPMATFIVTPGHADGTWCALKSFNHPEHYLRQWGNRVVLNNAEDNPQTFAAEATLCFIDQRGQRLHVPDDTQAGQADPYTTPGNYMGELLGKRIIIESSARPGQVLQLEPDRTRIRVGAPNQAVPGELFRVVPGLADPTHLSFESTTRPGYYLRHFAGTFTIEKFDDNIGYRLLTTFSVTPGIADAKLYSIRAYSELAHYLRLRAGNVVLNKAGDEPAATFAAEVTLRFLEDGKPISLTASDSEENFIRRGQPGAPPLERNGWMKPLLGQLVKIEPFTRQGCYLGTRANMTSVIAGAAQSDVVNQTFRVTPGLADKTRISFEAATKPGFFLRQTDNGLTMEGIKSGDAAAVSATFVVLPGHADARWCAMQAGTDIKFYPGVRGQETITARIGDADFNAVTTLRFIRHDGASIALPQPPLPAEPVNPCMAPLLGRTIRIAGARMPGRFLRCVEGQTEITIDSPAGIIAHDTFKVVPGLANRDCVSFESTSKPGFFLRHKFLLFWLERLEDTPLFREDATFIVQNYSSNGSPNMLRSYNYPDHYLRISNEPPDAGGKMRIAISPFPEKAELEIVRQFILGFSDQLGADVRIPFDAATPDAPYYGLMLPLIGRIVRIESFSKRNQFLQCVGQDDRPALRPADLETRESWFRVTAGMAYPGSVSFESVSRPGHYLILREEGLRVERYIAEFVFRVYASFNVVPGLADINWRSLSPIFAGHLYLRERENALMATPVGGEGMNAAATWRFEIIPNQ